MLARPRQFRRLYSIAVVPLVLAAVLFARLRAPSFHDSPGSRTAITATKSHSKKQCFNYKSQFQSAELTQVFRILPATDTLALIQPPDLVRSWCIPGFPFYDRPPPHC